MYLYTNERGTITTHCFVLKMNHRWCTAYHPQSNGAIEAFNKTLKKGLTKICNIDKDDWDEKIPTLLWAYRTTYKRSTDQTPFRLVYGQEAVVPLHFRQQTVIIAEILHVDVEQGRKDQLLQLSKLEEHQLIAIQHQEIQKQQQKAWHDQNIKKNTCRQEIFPYYTIVG